MDQSSLIPTVDRCLVFVLFLIDCVFFASETLFFRLGLLGNAPRSPKETAAYLLPSSNGLTSASSPSAPSRSQLKMRLPVVEFRKMKKTGFDCGCPESTCAVCLMGLEEKDEVRELGNCFHAFHKGCIDAWADLGKATCPLCRSPLLPPAAPAVGRERKKEGRNPGSDSSTNLYSDFFGGKGRITL